MSATPAESHAHTLQRISYRPPQERDLEQVARIYNHAVRETAATFDTEEKKPEYFRTFVPGSNLYRMLLAEVDGQVVGYAGCYPFSQRSAYSEIGEIMLYVHPSWQRRGIGSALLKEVHQSKTLDGLYTTLALINKDIVHMHRVVAELGYSYKGEMTDVGLKFGRRHSLVIYQLQLVQREEKTDSNL